MVYSSYEFIIFFLPIVLVIYYSLSKFKSMRFQKIFLIISSLCFYGYFNVGYLMIIVSSILINYCFAYCLQKKKMKAILFLGILFNIGLLGYFKYYDFFVSNVNGLFGTSLVLKNILLPLGISFFTFQQVSFLVSIYKREEKLQNFIDYCLFVAFFPQLVAGPIVLYSEMIPQFAEESRRYFKIDNFCKGLYVFSIGLFKKVVVADMLALFVDNGFALREIGFAAAWATAISYTLQIYFDFSGYSDMAIGLGKMFNIDLPDNFNSPYKSASITEFWRRWHMTLGRALTSYVYIPLGGNRKGICRTCINIMITFFISGLWHGASWTFVLWGILNGVIMVIERVGKTVLEKISRFIKIPVTFLITNLLWVLFRAENMEDAMCVYKGMFCFADFNVWQLQELAFDGLINFPAVMDILYVLIVLLTLIVMIFTRENSIYLRNTYKPDRKYALVVSFCFLISFICISRGSVFIYFNF